MAKYRTGVQYYYKVYYNGGIRDGWAYMHYEPNFGSYYLKAGAYKYFLIDNSPLLTVEARDGEIIYQNVELMGKVGLTPNM